MKKKTPKEALDEAIHKAGGYRALARRLGIFHNAIRNWRVTPPVRVLELEKLTGVSRHDLRPDLYPRGEA